MNRAKDLHFSGLGIDPSRRQHPCRTLLLPTLFHPVFAETRGGWSLLAVRSRAGALERGLFAKKSVAHSADGFDEVGGVSEFFSEGSHMNIDRAFQRIGIFAA